MAPRMQLSDGMRDESMRNGDIIENSDAEDEDEDLDDDENLDEDEDLDEDDDLYEDLNPNKLYLTLCELHYAYCHGYTESTSDPAILGHYLVIHTVNPLAITENGENGQNRHSRELRVTLNTYKREYKRMNLTGVISNNPHALIRNYQNIVSNEKYISPQLAQCIYLSGGECVAIIKTMWLKLIQRKWKSVFQNRRQIQELRCRLDNLVYREIHGTWPDGLNHLPTINGMLYGI